MKWLGSVIAAILGSAFSLLMLVVAIFSLPLTVIALMRWMGWEWLTALIAAVLLNVIPIAGQIAYVVLTIAGAYFLVSAGFNWQQAVYGPAVTATTWEEMSPSVFDEYKARVIKPELAKKCREETKGRYGTADGKIPVVVSNWCDCYAGVSVALLTQADMIAHEKARAPSPEFTNRLKAELSQCDPK